MRSSLLSLSTALVSLAGLAAAADFPTVEVVGNKFFYANNGSQFYIKGVAYQKNAEDSKGDNKFVDPLADEDTCKRDVPYLAELHTNVIRVYALDPSADHDPCMKLLQDAGIYVIADLSSPEDSIITTDPEWSVDLYERYTDVIDKMQGYDNILGFFAGNEVITNDTNTNTAPFIKAAVRDMKSYIKDKGYRNIPVGYSANDDADTRVQSADYFACGDNDVKADFYGINMYEWCGNSNFKESGYQDRTAEFANLTVPVFFSEYGCNAVSPRKFTEVQALYSDEMTDVWSGGIVYMYFQEENDYGLVSVDGDNVSTLDDFNYLKSELASISPSIGNAASASKEAHTLACPTEDKYWKAATVLPPTPRDDVCECISNSALCVVDDSVDDEDYGKLFSTVCEYIDCSDITANGEKGTYGGVAYCEPKEKLNYMLNKYYLDQDQHSSACDFNGSASVVKASASQNCSALIKSALASGNGSVATTSGSTKTTTNDKNSSSTSSTVSSISSKSEGKNAANGLTPPSYGVSGTYQVGVVVSIGTFFAAMLLM